MKQLVLLFIFLGIAARLAAQTNAEESINRAIEYHKNADYKTSITYCISALKFDKNHVNAHFLMGYNHYLLRNFKEAIVEFTETVRLNPTHLQAFYYRAKSKQEVKDFIGAISDFNTARQLNPGQTFFFMVRGWLGSLFTKSADNQTGTK